MTTKKGSTKPVKGKADADLEALAHHLSEVLRITREHPDIPARLYNGIAEAWTDFQNMTPDSNVITDSAEMIRLELFGGIAQRKAAAKGGAK
jgi:hypothetical protein